MDTWVDKVEIYAYQPSSSVFHSVGFVNAFSLARRESREQESEKERTAFAMDGLGEVLV